MKKFIVVEIVERSVNDVSLHETLRGAVTKANKLLKNHAINTGHHTEYANREGEGSLWSAATMDSFNAWTNWGDLHWDAYIIALTNDALK